MRKRGVKNVCKVSARETEMQLAFNKMGKTGKGTITGMKEGGRRVRNSILTG